MADRAQPAAGAWRAIEVSAAPAHAEGRRSAEANRGTLERPWELWKTKAMRR